MLEDTRTNKTMQIRESCKIKETKTSEKFQRKIQNHDTISEKKLNELY